MNERYLRAPVWPRGESYARLAACAHGRVLDLACGAACQPGAVGLDVACGPVQGRAQALPFADAAFDAVVCHLAFMLFDEVELVVAELARVLRPGGTFAAILGGGPTAHGDDAFHRFLAYAKPRALGGGDRRARTEEGWRALFAGWQAPRFERFEQDLGGPFADVWAVLATSYGVDAPDPAPLRAAFPGERVPCTAVLWLATVQTPCAANASA